ncbi:phosducin-like protein 2 [Mesoplodon densirostris]|uniref:phosducin-like protein 2 n=1 Tax=Mesoplodon densirostris TaxID=48708 RepID=UPI0028DBF43A|nr:phosducin-like protein 2 [Mesoplodon densirostris]
MGSTLRTFTLKSSLPRILLLLHEDRAQGLKGAVDTETTRDFGGGGGKGGRNADTSITNGIGAVWDKCPRPVGTARTSAGSLVASRGRRSQESPPGVRRHWRVRGEAEHHAGGSRGLQRARTPQRGPWLGRRLSTMGRAAYRECKTYLLKSIRENVIVNDETKIKGKVEKQDPNEDTEWNEILRDFGILPPKEEPKDEIEEMVLRLQKEAMVKPYEKMTLAQLKEAEDEFDDEDMRAIEIYREKRLQEWKALKKKQKFGELREISGNQYVNEVTNAEKDVWVIIHLYRSSIPMCSLVNQHLSLLARKFPETKFVKAIVNSCIQHCHDNCLPTIFVYKNGQIEGKFIGIIECGGINLKLEELEWKLAEVGAIQTDLEENPQKVIVDVMVSSIRNTSIYDDTNSSNSDNDDTK